MRTRFYRNSDGIDIYIENRQICDLFKTKHKVAKVASANGLKLERRNAETAREKQRKALRKFARENKLMTWFI